MRSRSGRLFIVTLTGLAALSCGGATGDDAGIPTDAGKPAGDAGETRQDSGTPDSDAGTAKDAGVDDAGVPHGDAGAPHDAGTVHDGGAGPSDAGTLSAGCNVLGMPTGDLHLHANDGNGTQRDYEMLVPSTYDPSKPLALSIVYHGAGNTSAGAKAFGLQNAPGASDAGIFLFPQGIAFQTYGVGWDDTCNGYDMPFFDAMVAYVEAHYCIDESRLFVAGFSWGGDQVTALACCRGNQIRAIGAASCTDEYSSSTDYTTYDNLPCPVKNHAAIRFTHDASNGDSEYAVPLFATTSSLYRSFNGCQSASTVATPSPCKAFSGCAQAYVECPYTALGHALPSGWGDDTWAFFEAFH